MNYELRVLLWNESEIAACESQFRRAWGCSEGEKTLEKVPCKLCEQQLTDGDEKTNLYHLLASLINNKVQLQNCLDIYKAQGPMYLCS